MAKHVFPTGKNHPDWNGGVWRKEGYLRVLNPGHPRAVRGYVLQHILVAEKALGKYLPEGTVVHHHDNNGENNDNSNLVICQDQGYHRILHQRMTALKASGNANWLKCIFCHTYDDRKNLFVSSSTRQRNYHRRCNAEYCRIRKKRQSRPEACL